MNNIQNSVTHSYRLPGNLLSKSVAIIAVYLLSLNVTLAAPVDIPTGSKVVLNIQGTTCDRGGADPDDEGVGCNTTQHPVSTEKKIIQVGTSLILAANERIAATGVVWSDFRVPLLGPSGPGGGESSNLSTVKVSTELEYNGLLTTDNFGSFLSGFSQIVMTLQVRDLDTGKVVASDTFLREGIFLKQLGTLVEQETVQGTTGADVTMHVVRGRKYRVEVEAQCTSLVAEGGLGRIACLFAEADSFDYGVLVDPFTVSVADDHIERMFPVLDVTLSHTRSIGTIVSDMAIEVAGLQSAATSTLDLLGEEHVNIANITDNVNIIITDLNAMKTTAQSLTDLITMLKSDLAAHDANLNQHDTAVQNMITTNNTDINIVKANLTAHDEKMTEHDASTKSLITNNHTEIKNTLDAMSAENRSAFLEIIRLLHTPSGVRTSEYQACEGDACTWNPK